MRIGVFGGTFDPVHNIHLNIAKTAREQFELDAVYMIPAYICPGKNNSTSADAYERLHMISLASEKYPWMIPSDIEIQRKGISYTYDTVCTIHETYPDSELFLIVGSDKIASIKNWYRAEELLNNVHLIVVKRQNDSYSDADGLDNCELKTEPSGLSSFEIRRRFQEGRTVSEYLPFNVENYIYENGLYFDSEVKRMQLKVKNDVNPQRFKHICAVMKRAAYLSELHNVDPKRAQISALLHDCAKSLPLSVLRLLADDDTKAVKVLHAPAGAVKACTDYYVKDQEILRAIRLHCTGDANMSRLAMLIYLADMTEDTRAFESVEIIRKASEIELEYGMREALKFSLSYLDNTETNIHPATMKAYRYYLNKKECE